MGDYPTRGRKGERCAWRSKKTATSGVVVANVQYRFMCSGEHRLVGSALAPAGLAAYGALVQLLAGRSLRRRRQPRHLDQEVKTVL